MKGECVWGVRRQFILATAVAHVARRRRWGDNWPTWSARARARGGAVERRYQILERRNGGLHATTVIDASRAMRASFTRALVGRRIAVHVEL